MISTRPLLTPILGCLPATDERMCAAIEAIATLVSCLTKAGEVERAEELLDMRGGYANDPDPLAEEIDTTDDELLDNFPEAFSHVNLITAALEIDNARGAASGDEASTR